MPRPYLIAIAGPSCSGKSTLARELASSLPATIFTLDSYYHDLAHLPLAERAKTNFDHPDSMDSALIIRHIEALMEGEEIQRPIYDFAAHIRTNRTESMRSQQFLIVEGLFTLYWHRLRELASLKIFMEAGSDVCLPRRQARDIAERGRTVESVVQQYAATVQPMTSQFINPTREFADLVLNGSDPAQKSAKAVLDFIQLRQTIPAARG
jgi:uridine kinase